MWQQFADKTIHTSSGLRICKPFPNIALSPFAFEINLLCNGELLFQIPALISQMTQTDFGICQDLQIQKEMSAAVRLFHVPRSLSRFLEQTVASDFATSSSVFRSTIWWSCSATSISRGSESDCDDCDKDTGSDKFCVSSVALNLSENHRSKNCIHSR